MTDEELRAMIDEFDRDGDGESMSIILKKNYPLTDKFRGYSNQPGLHPSFRPSVDKSL